MIDGGCSSSYRVPWLVFRTYTRGVATLGAIAAGLPPLTTPVLDLDLWLTLLPAAMLIALVGFVESVSVARTLAARRRERVRPNRELVGLGAANLTAAFSGGYPVTGGFARSAVNFDAGARTPAAGAFTALGVAFASVALVPFLAKLPIAVLSASIVVAVLSLVDPSAVARTWRYSRTDGLATVAPIAATLMIGVAAGIASGVALSVLLYLRAASRPHVAVVGRVPGTEHYRNVDRHAVVVSPHVLSLRIDETLFFGNTDAIEDVVRAHVVAYDGLTDVILQCSSVNGIDASALDTLEALDQRLSTSGVRLHLSEVKGPVMDRLAGTRLLVSLSGDVFLTQHAAMRALDPATLADTNATPTGEAA